MKKYISALLGSLLLSLSAHAASVTYNYTATVYLIYNYDYTQPRPLTPYSITLSDGTISIGNHFQGQFTYDTATSLQATNLEYDATYAGAAPTTTSGARFDNGVTFAMPAGAPQSTIKIYDNNPYLNDYLSIYADGQTADERAMTFNFASENESVMHGSAIPGALEAFERRFIYLEARVSPTSTFSALASIDSLTPTVAPVPEPETYAMLLAGIGLVGWTARRKKTAVAAS